ncbi:uncharacterized protein J4E88_005554 [Alternaria novae-zelandiae]|uniref:uncharacterized protein n=1 Tax=Alternaria novae-zelandiae TaxID=430562 RepID=UPI0020C4E301|nr:uncharacterized protein J4E88_005554 [Alternaria novae-zelandiae]KAI4681049.1 hypothetical protein J4E88_005554 [Alternaria novae-zelandiae]
MTTVEVARDGVALLYCAIILLVLSWIVFSMRVGVRMWRKAWGMDDYFMLVGTILFSVTAALCIVCCHYGSGQFARELPTVTISKGTKLFYIAEYFYAVSAMFVKISVAVALLRIAVGRRFFTWALWALIGATMVAALVFCIGIANIFAVMLALASFASCATIVRLKYLTLYSDPGEFMYSTGKIGFWSLTEVGIGLIAGSLPPLRPLLSLRIRVSAGSNSPAASGGQAYQSGINNRQPTSRSRVIAMDTFQTLGDNDEADNSDGDSQKNIIKETKFTVTSVIAGGPRDPGPMAWDRKEGSNV